MSPFLREVLFGSAFVLLVLLALGLGRKGETPDFDKERAQKAEDEEDS